ncbi:hypothetical protein E2562_027476 [Oryza meyeriana var. granulata]|uniref:Uncharacterized protein n=1 Tax=Oryza meyeriana var. granulata TaxID=110450 RepID=A0A6G1E1B8_9ORYZ|nr:hypothetical protein E2562_027476 [Oryza meyeriana var. granulata]
MPTAATVSRCLDRRGPSWRTSSEDGSFDKLVDQRLENKLDWLELEHTCGLHTGQQGIHRIYSTAVAQIAQIVYTPRCRIEKQLQIELENNIDLRRFVNIA